MGESLCRVDDQIVVFNHLELTQFLAFCWFIQNAFIDSLSQLGYNRHTSGTESLISLDRTNPSQISCVFNK
jgi:hypothetical protein